MEKNKLFLRVMLIIYIVTTILGVFSDIDIPVLKEIIKLRHIYIPITSVLIIAYAWDKGAEGIGKLAVASICGMILLDLVGAYEIIPKIFSNDITSNGYDAYVNASRVVYVLDRICYFGMGLCTMLALFSIIPMSNSKNSTLELAAILFFVGAIILDLIYYFSANTKLFATLESVFSKASDISEYLVVALYLLSRNISKEETPQVKEENTTITTVQQPVTKSSFTIENSVQQSTSPQIQQVLPQPMTQPVQQVIQQPMTQPVPQQNNIQ